MQYLLYEKQNVVFQKGKAQTVFPCVKQMNLTMVSEVLSDEY